MSYPTLNLFINSILSLLTTWFGESLLDLNVTWCFLLGMQKFVVQHHQVWKAQNQLLNSKEGLREKEDDKLTVMMCASFFCRHYYSRHLHRCRVFG